MVAIYAFLVCKISGPKIWSCKFFDKSHVCRARVNIEYCLGTMRLLNHSSLDYQSSKRWELLPSSGLWVSRSSTIKTWQDVFFKSQSIQGALFKSCTWPLHNFSELNFAFLLCKFSSIFSGLTFGVPMLMFFTTRVDNKDPERR